MLNWNRQRKTRATRNQPSVSQEERPEAGHCDQHRPAFVLIEGEPLVSFGQPQEPLDGQQDRQKAAWGKAIPAGFGSRIGHVSAESRNWVTTAEGSVRQSR